jgi:hypothetical protein
MAGAFDFYSCLARMMKSAFEKYSAIMQKAGVFLRAMVFPSDETTIAHFDFQFRRPIRAVAGCFSPRGR